MQSETSVGPKGRSDGRNRRQAAARHDFLEILREGGLGSAEITERSRRFTDSDESKTLATSGSRTTASVVPPIGDANRFRRL